MANPDHVADSGATFAGTAAVSTLGDAVLIAAGWWTLRRLDSPRGGATTG